MMANGYEKHILIGLLSNNPGGYTNQKGQIVTNFDIAVNQSKNESNACTWYQITATGALAEACAEHLEVGHRVMVTGTNLKAAWVNRNGQLCIKMELAANEVKLLGW
ncbi:MAG: single-stranded DNA-binding protein [Ardenticatenaceae bacterium]